MMHPRPMTNIATGVAFPDGNHTTRLINAHSIGLFRLKLFPSERINSNIEDIMAPLPRENLKTFSNLRKPVKDRRFLVKLLILEKDDDIHLIHVSSKNCIQ